MKNYASVLLTLILALPVLSQTSSAALSPEEQKIETFDAEVIPFKKIFTELPQTSWTGIKNSFAKDTIGDWALVIGSTLVLLHNDEVILRDIQRGGRDLGYTNDDNTKAILSAGEIDLIRLPTDFPSFTYFLGDGFMHGGIAAGFLINGYGGKNSRAANTGLQLVHGMMVSTVFNQFLKRSFGRESPYVKTEPFGRWSPYPSIKEYQARTSKYDAMPSGHIMTTTLVFTIINENYPEYSHITVPVAVTWGTLLMVGMVNNGVHWASDYPLGIAMGFVFGRASAKLGKKQTPAEKQAAKNWNLMPVANSEMTGVNFVYRY